ncbi:hypothetical protein CTI12_AA628280 [Artemisia annua]|uniref:Uncharacterized protein n=1 Tax=Artemisia annua TaxID=35608 RepID=A0A2U1K9N5_ARTAN|nr:hypothetical protein CTI12_AA628280 [Artemisia annua]
MSDEPLGNSDSMSRSFDVTISNPLFEFDDNFTLRIDNKIFDDEFEDLCSLDPPKSTPLIDESTLLVTPLPVSKQICLREVERFDPFFSLTQSGDMTIPFDREDFHDCCCCFPSSLIQSPIDLHVRNEKIGANVREFEHLSNIIEARKKLEELLSSGPR